MIYAFRKYWGKRENKSIKPRGRSAAGRGAACCRRRGPAASAGRGRGSGQRWGKVTFGRGERLSCPRRYRRPPGAGGGSEALSRARGLPAELGLLRLRAEGSRRDPSCVLRCRLPPSRALGAGQTAAGSPWGSRAGDTRTRSCKENFARKKSSHWGWSGAGMRPQKSCFLHYVPRNTKNWVRAGGSWWGWTESLPVVVCTRDFLGSLNYPALQHELVKLSLLSRKGYWPFNCGEHERAETSSSAWKFLCGVVKITIKNKVVFLLFGVPFFFPVNAAASVEMSTGVPRHKSTFLKSKLINLGSCSWEWRDKQTYLISLHTKPFCLVAW